MLHVQKLIKIRTTEFKTMMSLSLFVNPVTRTKYRLLRVRYTILNYFNYIILALNINLAKITSLSFVFSCMVDYCLL